MKIEFEQSIFAEMNEVNIPEYAHFDSDSGLDVFSPISLSIHPNERITVDLGVKFAIPRPWWMKLLGMSVELQIRPKSGRSKAGLEVSLGTIDNGYRNYTGATIHNYSDHIQEISKNEKLCQIVVMPVFTRVKFIKGIVDACTSRGLKGFGQTGLTKS